MNMFASLLVFFVVFWSSETQAGDIIRKDGAEQSQVFSALCIADHTTGLNWENHQWVKSNFLPDKFIVQKFKIEKYDPNSSFDESPNSGICSESSNPDHKNYPHVYGCYNFRKIGRPLFKGGSQMCTEYWGLLPYPEDRPKEFSKLLKYLESKKKWRKSKLQKVICDSKIADLVFSPNGLFQHSTMFPDVRETAPIKDSMTVSVGKCTVLD